MFWKLEWCSTWFTSFHDRHFTCNLLCPRLHISSQPTAPSHAKLLTPRYICHLDHCSTCDPIQWMFGDQGTVLLRNDYPYPIGTSRVETKMGFDCSDCYSKLRTYVFLQFPPVDPSVTIRPNFGSIDHWKGGDHGTGSVWGALTLRPVTGFAQAGGPMGLSLDSWANSSNLKEYLVKMTPRQQESSSSSFVFPFLIFFFPLFPSFFSLVKNFFFFFKNQKSLKAFFQLLLKKKRKKKDKTFK